MLRNLSIFCYNKKHENKKEPLYKDIQLEFFLHWHRNNTSHHIIYHPFNEFKNGACT